MLEELKGIALAVLSYIFSAGQELIGKILTFFETVRINIESIRPTQDLVLWIQLVVGFMTIVWIVFQFAWLRRLNESRLEKHLEQTISAERDDLADERH